MINKYLLLICFSVFSTLLTEAQNLIPIPDTLSGTDIHLYLKDSSKTFFTGFSTKTIGYNGSYLGKTLILQKGQTVKLNVHNELADTSTTHWHGLHVAPKNDGSPHNIIKTGQVWSPSFMVIDDAGTYWYHPHLHGKTLKQVVKGAAGLIIVRDNTEGVLPLPRTYGVDDIPLVFQFQTFDNATKQIVLDDELDNTVLVNGTVNGAVNAPAQIVRLRLLNASSHRVFRFGFADNRAFRQIATDGGLLNAPVSLTRLNLGSGERAEILVDLTGLQGSTLQLKTFGNELPTGYPGGPPMNMPGISNMTGSLDNIAFNVLQINVVAPTPRAVFTMPTTLVNNTPLSSVGASTRQIGMSAQPMMSMTNFFLNNAKYDEQVINFTTQQEKSEVWVINNQTMMAHPFHIHGNSFYILSINGATPPPNMRGKKDVVIVPPMNGQVQLVTKYEHYSDPTMPYMYHCHILSHEDNGMMGQFVVSPLISATHDMPHDASIRIYPNPVSGSEMIQIEAQTAIQSVMVFDILGRHIFSKNGTQQTQMTLPLSLSNGLYVFDIQTVAGVSRQKVVVTN